MITRPPKQNRLRSTALWFAVLWFTVASFALFGCADDPTQLLVTVDSNLTPISQLTQVKVEVSEVRTMSAADVSEYAVSSTHSASSVAIPFSFTVVPKNEDSSRRAFIKVTGRLIDGTQVERMLERGFIDGQVINASVFLSSACVGVVCLVGQTCDEGTCVDIPTDGMSDAGPDATADAMDTMVDAGTDGSADVGTPPPPPVHTRPMNGEYTGSIHAPGSSDLDVYWEAAPDATHYLVEVHPCDGPGCALSAPIATMMATETEASVTVPGLSLAPPVGGRVLWRVQSCNADGCGEFSEPWYVNLARLQDDVNGDGYSDLIVGAPYDGDGVTYVVPGGPRGREPVIAALRPPGPGARVMGREVTAGDFNGDGFADVAVAMGNQFSDPPDPGAVVIFAGGASSGLVATESLSAPTPDANFAAGMTCAGDVNADGRDDLVVTAYGEREAYLYLSASGAPQPLSRPGVRPWAHTNAVGDLDLDGFADFAVQDASETAVGGVILYAGGRAGVTLVSALEPPDGLGDGLRFGSGFGGAIEGGDFDGDGRPDLIVGAPQAEAVVAYLSGGAELTFGAPQTFVSPVADMGSGYGYGAGLQAVDVQGDGRDELVVSDPRHADSVGLFDVVAFDNEGRTSHDDYFGEDEMNGSRRPLASGDLDGDGAEEVIIGGPSVVRPSMPGVVAVIYDAGPDREFSAIWDPSGERGNGFGLTVD